MQLNGVYQEQKVIFTAHHTAVHNMIRAIPFQILRGWNGKKMLQGGGAWSTGKIKRCRGRPAPKNLWRWGDPECYSMNLLWRYNVFSTLECKVEIHFTVYGWRVLVRMLTPEKRLKSWFAFGISNTSWRLLFPDQNWLNFPKIHMGRHKCQFGTRIKGPQRVLWYKNVKGQNQGSATRLYEKSNNGTNLN